MKRKYPTVLSRLTAYHEAAHTVIALRFNVRISEVALDPHAPGNGYMRYAGVPFNLKAALEAATSPAHVWRIVNHATEKNIMIGLAGALAEGKLHGSDMRTEGAKSDLEKVVRMCEDLVALRRELYQLHPIAPEEMHLETQRIATRLRRKTRRLLGHPKIWLEISTLAEELLLWQKLSGDDAADTIQFTRRPPGQMSLQLPLPALTPSKPDSFKSSRTRCMNPKDLNLTQARHACDVRPFFIERFPSRQKMWTYGTAANRHISCP